MADNLLLRASGSAATLRRVGVALGLLLVVCLAVLLYHDRQTRIDAAYRQSLAVATGADRLLHYGLRSVERAMDSVAGESAAWHSADPSQQDALLAAAIARIVARQDELHSVSLVDDQGRALLPGTLGDPEFAQWHAARKGHAGPLGLVTGPLQADGAGGWWLRLAAPLDRGRWLLARMDTSAIDAMIGNLDVGRDGNVTVLDREGVVLARLPVRADGKFVGRNTRLPPSLGRMTGTTFGLRVSPIDRVERLSGFSATSGYDVVVAAGLGYRETLMPWYRSLAIMAGLVLLYWLALGYFLHRLSGGERMREALLAELEEQAAWLDQAQQAARTGVWRLEADGNRVKVSAHTAAMFGFASEPIELPAERFFERLHPDDRARVEAMFWAARDSGTPYSVEYRVRPRPGIERWIRAAGGLVSDSHGQSRVTGTVIDITERHEERQRVERAEAQFRALFQRNPLPFWVFDLETLRFLAVNDTAQATYGYDEEEFRAMTILDLRPTTSHGAVLESMRRRGPDEDVDGVWTHLRSDGSRLDARVFSSGIEFGGRPARLVLAEDVSDRMAYERDLAWRATHDSVTGLIRLPALADELNSSHTPGARYAVAFVRLRDMELVSSTLGTRTSELLLREMAARMTVVAVEFGLAGYWPDASFLVVSLDPSRAADMVAALEQAIAMPVETDFGAHPIEASIGVAEGPESGEDAEKVIGHAALAALQAWQDQVAVLPYDRAMAAKAEERLSLSRRLSQALENGEFALHYQPVRRVDDGRVVSLEALLRWHHDGGFVSPAVFIPLAEASGLIVPIGRWVLEQAARTYLHLVGCGLGSIPVAVNVSAVQLLADSVPDAVRELQQQYALPPGALHVELTESVLLRRPQAARACMQQLRDAGLPIAIDDFGTGFSSLSYLRELPLDALKIDRSFVQDVHADERNASICRALLALARGLGLATIAEGVENEADLAWLRANGCDQAQGYLLGRPMPLDALVATLKAENA